MTFVVKRPHGRFEVRESTLTPRGPRARTLAAFRELSDDVLDAAEARALHALDRARVRARAIALGAPTAPPRGQLAAHDLLAALGSGERLPTAVRTLLQRALAAPGEPLDPRVDHLVAVLPWIGASDQARSAALVDLLGVADAVPAPRRGDLRYPRLESR